MLGLKLNHVSKRGYRYQALTHSIIVIEHDREAFNTNVFWELDWMPHSARNGNGIAKSPVIKRLLAAGLWMSLSIIWEKTKCFNRPLSRNNDIAWRWNIIRASLNHFMKKPSHRSAFGITSPLWRESISEFPSQRPLIQTFDISFDLSLNNSWKTQSSGS